MADVRIFQTNDAGDIDVKNGIVATDGGLESAVYLALFGGNIDDDKSQNTPFNWWGNLNELDPARQYRSETQRLIRDLPPISANLLRIEDAVKRDLAFMKEERIASEIVVVVTLTGINRINITITIDGDNTIKFTENWIESRGT